ncbi:hypothetical protein FSP39_004121 [Pinctada imbricata]|uniref:Uncharacterized protein n=1 Tax=Pinctada imbricata TaxID=66713 RepID=A0AA88YUC9_PINIB|nr:hypothetical protein FSP39_004121 [Pinctada imbricata]
MRSKTKAALRKVAFIISGCGFVLYFVAYLIPFWSRFRQPGTNIDFRYGIFITCITDSFKSTCNFIHLTVVYGNWVKVVQGVGGTGLVFYFISMATGFLAFYWKNRVQKTLLYVSASCGFAAGIFIAVTVFLYANSNESQQDSLDFGFYFAIISIVPILIGGIFQVFNGKQVIIPTRAYEEKKKKKRMEIAREHIIDAMMNMSPDDLKSHPPMSVSGLQHYILVLALICSVCCLPTFATGTTNTILQRINYGVTFHKTADIYLGQEYWAHTFEIPLPRKVHIQERARCNLQEPICTKAKSVIMSLNKLKIQAIASVNQTVHEIHQLIPTSVLPKQDTFFGRSRSRRGLFDFIGKISKSLFGTATSSDINTLKRHMQALNQNNVKIAKAMATQEKHLSSFISSVDERFQNVMNAVKQNHNDAVALSKLMSSSFDALSHEVMILETLTIEQINASAKLDLTLEHLKTGVHDLVKGKLSPFLLSSHAIRTSINQVQNIIDAKFSLFNIIHKDPTYYYSHADFLYTRLHSKLYITLKIPISPFKHPLSLYQIYSFPVPVNSTSTHATQLLNTPDHFIHTSDNQHFSTLSLKDLTKCSGSGTLYCPFQLALTSSASASCISAIFYNLKTLTKQLCDFRFITGAIKPSITELSPSSILLYSTNMMALDCPSGQRIMKGCSFCVIKVPCMCSLTSGDLFFPPRVGNCHNNSDSVTVLHPINLALIQELFDPSSHASIFGDTVFQNLVDMKIPDFKIFNHSFSKYLANDHQHHLSLKRLAQTAKKDEMAFRSLSESMLAGQIDFAIDSWPDTSGIIAIVASGVAGLSLAFGIWTFFKIRTLTSALLLLQASHPSSAFVTARPNFSFIFSHPADTTTPKSVAEHIYHSFTTPWPYVSLSVITTIIIFSLILILWHKFKHTHRTAIHLELTTGAECTLIKLTELSLCPENWNITPPEDITNIIITTSCFIWTTLTIHSSKFTVTNVYTEQTLTVPTTINISPLKAFKIRRILRQPYSAYFMLSHHEYFRMLQ